MTKILDFEAGKQRRLDQLLELEKEGFVSELNSLGIEVSIDGQLYFPQGTKPSEPFKNCKGIDDMNMYGFKINNQLIKEGFYVAGAVPFDEHYFANRDRHMKDLGYKTIKEERSHTLFENKPMIAFYGKH